MKKLRLICVGKVKESFYRQGIEEYLKRARRFADITVTELKDFPDTCDSVRRESDEILSCLGKVNVLTDIEGRQLSSRELSEYLDSTFASVGGEIAFIIGGSGGVDERVKRAADIKISFGKFTYPHMLMRLMLCEQLYRALSISAKTPYHK